MEILIPKPPRKRRKHTKYMPPPNSLANLAPPFPPGVNGQIATGRVKGYSLKARLRDSLDKKLVAPTADSPAVEHLIHSTIEGAIAREPTPFKEVWDRIDGRVEERHVNLNVNVKFVVGRGYVTDGNRNDTDS